MISKTVQPFVSFAYQTCMHQTSRHKATYISKSIHIPEIEGNIKQWKK